MALVSGHSRYLKPFCGERAVVVAFALYLAAAIRYYDRFLASKEIKATSVAQDTPTESITAPSEPPPSSEFFKTSGGDDIGRPVASYFELADPS